MTAHVETATARDFVGTQPSGDQVELSIVIPVRDEGANIIETLQALHREVPVSHEILIVYDRDDDTTLPAVRQYGGHDCVALIKNTLKTGPSGALRTGFACARGVRVLVVMADRCDDLTQLQAMIRLVPADADVVCPSRYCAGGAQLLEGTPKIKIWLPRMAGWLLKHLAGLATADPTNSFKLYSAALLQELQLSSTVSFSVTLEIIAKAHCLGRRIVEVPTVWRDRQHGKSHFRIGPSLLAYLPWFLLALWRGRVVRVPSTWLQGRRMSPRVSTVRSMQAVTHG